MVPIMLLMLAGGIGLTQAVSDPAAVTLRWLRLGGLIAVTLLVIAVAAVMMGDGSDLTAARRTWLPHWFAIPALLGPPIFQLMLTQVGKRRSQRACALASFLVTSAGVALMLGGLAFPEGLPSSSDVPPIGEAITVAMLTVTAPLAAGLLGGFLMTMLLGHAYLTAGNEMTQAPFRRLVLLLAALLFLRTITSVTFGLLPWLASERTGSQLWPTMIIIARYAVGIVATGIFTWMVWDCVKRRANQSATGILYVAGVLIIVGEWSALALIERTGFGF